MSGEQCMKNFRTIAPHSECMQKRNADLGCGGDLNPEGLCLRGPTTGDAPVLLRLHHLMLILHIGPQPIPRGFSVAAGAPRSILAQLRRGLGGTVPGGGGGRGVGG